MEDKHTTQNKQPQNPTSSGEDYRRNPHFKLGWAKSAIEGEIFSLNIVIQYLEEERASRAAYLHRQYYLSAEIKLLKKVIANLEKALSVIE